MKPKKSQLLAKGLPDAKLIKKYESGKIDLKKTLTSMLKNQNTTS
jgi:hypothetical protein